MWHNQDCVSVLFPSVWHRHISCMIFTSRREPPGLEQDITWINTSPLQWDAATVNPCHLPLLAFLSIAFFPSAAQRQKRFVNTTLRAEDRLQPIKEASPTLTGRGNDLFQILTLRSSLSSLLTQVVTEVDLFFVPAGVLEGLNYLTSFFFSFSCVKRVEYPALWHLLHLSVGNTAHIHSRIHTILISCWTSRGCRVQLWHERVFMPSGHVLQGLRETTLDACLEVAMTDQVQHKRKWGAVLVSS